MSISVAVADWNPNGNNGRGKIRASVTDSARFNKLLLTKVNKVDAELNEYNQERPRQETLRLLQDGCDDRHRTALKAVRASACGMECNDNFIE